MRFGGNILSEVQKYGIEGRLTDLPWQGGHQVITVTVNYGEP